MANTPTDSTKSTAKKPQTHKAEDHAEEPSKPSESRWGVKQSSMGEGGVDIGSLSPGKSGDASY